MTPAERTVRAAVALGAGIMFATIATAVASSVFSHIASVTKVLAPGTIMTLTATTYLLVFLFTFPRAYRARLRLHRILLEIWDNSGKKPQEQQPREKLPPRQRAEGFCPWDTISIQPSPPPPPVLDNPPPQDPKPQPTVVPETVAEKEPEKELAATKKSKKNAAASTSALSRVAPSR